MALASRPRNSLNDENSHPSTLKGMAPAGGGQGLARSGLKQQQLTTNERRILSDISNAKPPSSFGGTPKPSPKPGLLVFRSENLPPKAGGAAPPPQSSSQKSLARIPLRNIVNESQRPATTFRGGVKPSLKKKAGTKVLLTVEQLRQAEEWAKEDLPIEHTHFTGQDMDALREKMMEAEIEETVAMVRNYRASGVPSFSKPALDDTQSIYFEDGRLKPDLRSNSFDEDTEQLLMRAEALQVEDDPVLTRLTSNVDDFQYPSIPENWHVVRDDSPAESG